jgi:prevent-host-death family protein
MQTISSRQARQRFRDMLNSASRGETVRITRRGEEVARLVPPPRPNSGVLPDLTAFRKRLKGKVKGKPLSRTVIEMREETRI